MTCIPECESALVFRACRLLKVINRHQFWCILIVQAKVSIALSVHTSQGLPIWQIEVLGVTAIPGSRCLLTPS